MTITGRNLRVHFKGVKAVDDIDIDVYPGEILGLIGPNGAGKTTLVNAMTGFVRLTYGRLKIGPKTADGLPANRIARLGVARTFQSVRAFRGMTARQNVEVGGLGAGLSPSVAKKQADELLEMMALGHRSNSYASDLSFGEEQRLSIARALATRPTYLFLDEPAAGLNEAEGRSLSQVIVNVRDERGCGVVLIDHDMHLVLNLCNRIQVLNNGRTISVGSPREVQRDPAVIDAYLGTRQFHTKADRKSNVEDHSHPSAAKASSSKDALSGRRAK